MRDESVVIGEPGENQILVTVVDIRGDKVRLGFTARRDLAIHRQEIYELIQEQKQQSGDAVPGLE
jgi:carbon storage regulator